MVENRRLIAGVIGVAFNEKGEVLLTQRHEPSVPNEHAKWQLPGGSLEFGEHPEDTLKREMQEELNTKATIISPGPIIRSHKFKEKKLGDDNLTSYQLLMLAYIISLESVDIDISGDQEASSSAWIPVDKIATLSTLPLVQGIVNEAKERLDTNR